MNCSNRVSWVLAQVTVSIIVLECEEPEVQMAQTRLAIWRFQPILVEASVDLKGCIRYGPQFLWQIVSASSCDSEMIKGNPLLPGSETQPSQVSPGQEVHLPMEVDVRRLQLSLPKMALAAGNYSLLFSLSYEGVPLRKAACLQLSVMAAKWVEKQKSLLTLSGWIKAHTTFILQPNSKKVNQTEKETEFKILFTIEH